jgi:hypothetical protein
MALEVAGKHRGPLNGGNFLPLSEPECFSEASKAIPVAQRLGVSASSMSWLFPGNIQGGESTK